MCFHITFSLPLSSIAKLLFYCLTWLFSVVAAVWDRTGLDLLQVWFRLNYYGIKKIDLCVCVCVCDPRPLQLLPSPCSACIPQEHCELIPLKEVLHQPWPALGLLPTGHHGQWHVPQGEWEKNRSMTVCLHQGCTGRKYLDCCCFNPFCKVGWGTHARELRITWDLLKKWKCRVKPHKSGVWISPSQMLVGEVLLQ